MQGSTDITITARRKILPTLDILTPLWSAIMKNYNYVCLFHSSIWCWLSGRAGLVRVGVPWPGCQVAGVVIECYTQYKQRHFLPSTHPLVFDLMILICVHLQYSMLTCDLIKRRKGGVVVDVWWSEQGEDTVCSLRSVDWLTVRL